MLAEFRRTNYQEPSPCCKAPAAWQGSHSFIDSKKSHWGTFSLGCKTGSPSVPGKEGGGDRTEALPTDALTQALMLLLMLRAHAFYVVSLDQKTLISVDT